jgi:hypothetical protein
VVLAGREALVGSCGAPARARPSRRALGRAGAPWGPNPKTDDAFRAVITSLWLVLVL